MKQLKHYIGAGLIVAILTAGIGLWLQPSRVMPAPASRQAGPIDSLFGFHFWAISFLWSLIVGFLIYSIIVFRRKKNDETGDHIEGNNSLEIVWTIIPTGLVLYISFIGAQALADITAIDPEAMRVEVQGFQWDWRFTYIDEDTEFSSDILALPVNQQALLRLNSSDVIHSFWVPEFRVKQDLLPGDEVRELRITPNKEGDFTLRCAELCGTSHARMTAEVVVMSQEDFDAWVQNEIDKLTASPEARGKIWATQYGCAGCHSVDGSIVVGPSWLGLFGREESLSDGSTVVVDEAYIIESVKEPNAKVVAGFAQGVMNPVVYEGITDDQINDIIEYIKTLE